MKGNRKFIFWGNQMYSTRYNFVVPFLTSRSLMHRGVKCDAISCKYIRYINIMQYHRDGTKVSTR